MTIFLQDATPPLNICQKNCFPFFTDDLKNSNEMMAIFELRSDINETITETHLQ